MNDLAGPTARHRTGASGTRPTRATGQARGAGRHVARRSRRVLVPLTLGMGLVLLLTAAGVDGPGAAGSAPGAAGGPPVSLWGAAVTGALMLLVVAAVALLLVPTRRAHARGSSRDRSDQDGLRHGRRS